MDALMRNRIVMLFHYLINHLACVKTPQELTLICACQRNINIGIIMQYVPVKGI